MSERRPKPRHAPPAFRVGSAEDRPILAADTARVAFKRWERKSEKNFRTAAHGESLPSARKNSGPAKRVANFKSCIRLISSWVKGDSKIPFAKDILFVTESKGEFGGKGRTVIVILHGDSTSDTSAREHTVYPQHVIIGENLDSAQRASRLVH